MSPAKTKKKIFVPEKVAVDRDVSYFNIMADFTYSVGLMPGVFHLKNCINFYYNTICDNKCLYYKILTDVIFLEQNISALSLWSNSRYSTVGLMNFNFKRQTF